MGSRQLSPDRLSVVSSKPFADVVAALDAVIGHPSLDEFWNEVCTPETYSEVEQVIQRALGSSGFMEFARYDLGVFLRQERSERSPKSVRMIIGDPRVMKRMVKHVPDAGSYAPVTILIDERPDGVHLSYDRMASFLAPYGHSEALDVAGDLDSKVAALLAASAA
jgi:uncharacterized protein (DUF302 family)